VITGSVYGVVRNCGRNMVKLNLAQIRMREDFLKIHTASKRASPDTSEFCFLCDKPGDNRQSGSMFSTLIPCNPGKGFIMDEITGIWVCSSCVVVMEKKI
jgi:hypothetical protein